MKPLPTHIENSPSTLSHAWRVFFRQKSPLVILFFLLSSLSFRIYLGRFRLWDLAVVFIILSIWPIVEWLIHVYLLHFKPIKIGTFTLDPLVAREHRKHHDDPWLVPQVFIPLPVYLYAPVIIVGVSFLFTPTLELAMTATSFIFVLTLHYEWTHYFCHIRYTPKSRFYLRLWKNHRLHHFKDETLWFGVSMLSGDKIFKTRGKGNL